MDEKLYLKKLALREIKPTAIRLLILKTMMQHKEAFFLIGFGKRFRYRRQIYHLSHYYPIPDTPSHSCHRRQFGLSENMPFAAMTVIVK